MAICQITGTLGNMNTVGLMKKAMGEAQLSVEIYTDFFGEAPYKRLAMTQQTATQLRTVLAGAGLPADYLLF